MSNKKRDVQLVQYEHQFLLELHAKVTHIQGMSLQTLQLLAHLEQSLQKPYNVICQSNILFTTSGCLSNGAVTFAIATYASPRVFNRSSPRLLASKSNKENKVPNKVTISCADSLEHNGVKLRKAISANICYYCYPTTSINTHDVLAILSAITFA